MQGKCTYPIVSLKSEQAMTKEEIKEIAKEVVNNTIFCTKAMLTSDEAAAYMGIAKSYLYKLTMKQVIPHYKPMGKMCYFNRVELESWLQSNRVATADEISQQAQTYCMRKGGKR
jgi:excisionase family DNA binding protein